MEFLGTVIKPDGKSTNDEHDNRATVHDTPSTPSNQESLSSSDINTQLTEDVEAQPPDKLERYYFPRPLRSLSTSPLHYL